MLSHTKNFMVAPFVLKKSYQRAAAYAICLLAISAFGVACSKASDGAVAEAQEAKQVKAPHVLGVQEKIWKLAREGRVEEAQALKESLYDTLRSEHFDVLPLKIKGLAKKAVIQFPGGIKAIFKLDTPYGRDGMPPEVEEATYVLDQIFEVNAVPMTLVKENVTIPNVAKREKGSVQVFIDDVVEGGEYQKKLGLDPDIDPTDEQFDKIVFLDAIMSNDDRHPGNYLVQEDTLKIIAIDHGVTFYNGVSMTMFIKYLNHAKTIQVGNIRFVRLINYLRKDLAFMNHVESIEESTVQSSLAQVGIRPGGIEKAIHNLHLLKDVVRSDCVANLHNVKDPNNCIALALELDR